MGRLILGFLAALLFCTQPAFGQGRIFYDGFESGNTSLWRQDSYRDRCQAVSSPGDGGVGPAGGSYLLRCNLNGTLEWNAPSRFETLLPPVIDPGNEFLVRTRIRISPNLYSTGAAGDWTGPKLFRFTNGAYDAFLHTIDVPPNSSPAQVGWAHDQPGTASTQWGMGNLSRTGWTNLAMYFNKSSRLQRIWIDGAIVRDTSALDISDINLNFVLIGNWSGAAGTREHDATNYVFFDEFEIYASTGSGGSGSMSDNTITASGGGSAPTVSAVTCSPSVIQSGNGSTTCSATYGNSPTSYAWTGARSCCSFGTPSASSTTYTCTCGGSDTVCVNATNGSGSSGATCTSSSVTYRYARPSNVSVN